MITKIEYTIQKHVIENKNIIFLIFLFLLSIVIRISGRDFLSGDMQRFLIPWFYEIKEHGGLHSLSEQIGDYGLLYQTLISFMTYIEINPLYLYKMLSAFFDVLLAFSVYKVIRLVSPTLPQKYVIASGGGNITPSNSHYKLVILGAM